MPKNKELQAKLIAYEAECRAKEDNAQYTPKKKIKTCDIIEEKFKQKRRDKIEKKINEVFEKAYKIDKEFLKEQIKQVEANQKRREKKYGFNLKSYLLKKLLSK